MNETTHPSITAGVHHVGLTVLDLAQTTLLEDQRAKIEFAPEPLGEGPVRHMMCAIPGGIRVEFIAAGS